MKKYDDRRIAIFPLASLNECSFGDRIRKEMEQL